MARKIISWIVLLLFVVISWIVGGLVSNQFFGGNKVAYYVVAFIIIMIGLFLRRLIAGETKNKK